MLSPSNMMSRCLRLEACENKASFTVWFVFWCLEVRHWWDISIVNYLIIKHITQYKCDTFLSQIWDRKVSHLSFCIVLIISTLVFLVSHLCPTKKPIICIYLVTKDSFRVNFSFNRWDINTILNFRLK
ncbi:MAG: hypothetical protein ACI82Q_002403 [Nonlabens sp.]|jgi:hypothetical protein